MVQTAHRNIRKLWQWCYVSLTATKLTGNSTNNHEIVIFKTGWSYAITQTTVYQGLWHYVTLLEAIWLKEIMRNSSICLVALGHTSYAPTYLRSHVSANGSDFENTDAPQLWYVRALPLPYYEQYRFSFHQFCYNQSRSYCVQVIKWLLTSTDEDTLVVVRMTPVDHIRNIRMKLSRYIRCIWIILFRNVCGWNVL